MAIIAFNFTTRCWELLSEGRVVASSPTLGALKAASRLLSRS